MTLLAFVLGAVYGAIDYFLVGWLAASAAGSHAAFWAVVALFGVALGIAGFMAYAKSEGGRALSLLNAIAMIASASLGFAAVVRLHAGGGVAADFLASILAISLALLATFAACFHLGRERSGP